MAEKKKIKVSQKDDSKNSIVADDLSQFIEKKRIQNGALKKIVDKLNSIDKNKNNK